MGKWKVYQVCLVFPSILNKNLHYEPFSQNWWKRWCTNNTTKTSRLYLIRINMKTLVFFWNI